MTDRTTEEDVAKAQPEIEPAPLVLASELLPTRLPILPIRPRPLFPGLPIPLEVGGEQIQSIQHALEFSSKTLGIVLVRDPNGGETPDNLYRVGVAAKILRVFQGENESTNILINCVERFTTEDITKSDFGIMANVKYQLPAPLIVTEELKAYAMAVVTTLKDLVKLNPLQSEAIKMFLSRSTFDDPGRLADFSANLTTASGAELAGSAGNLRRAGPHRSRPGVAEEGSGNIQAPRRNQQADTGEDLRTATRIFPEGTAEGHQKRAWAREGRENRRNRKIPGETEKPDAQRGSPKSGRRRDGQASTPGTALSGIHGFPKLSGLAHDLCRGENSARIPMMSKKRD